MIFNAPFWNSLRLFCAKFAPFFLVTDYDRFKDVRSIEAIEMTLNYYAVICG